MIYLVIGIVIAGGAVLILVWFRKVQYDAVHRNFLDLVDKYGGRVMRGGFAIRPRYSGTFNNSRLAISISSEKKKNGKNRQFYISIYMQSSGSVNYTILSEDWMENQSDDKESKRIFKEIWDSKYLLEVSDENILKKLDLEKIENIVRRMHPFAYVLVSKKGLILERVSNNLIKDSEYHNLYPLLEGMYDLGQISVRN
ncbi:MAG: hypothetical protein EH225_12240 [Calditrichaeota bacterium]|nr:hypothetical protein [Calditrichota bacterium]RQV92469.1 MAG: hypothetical protein EH221_11450 [bacterium]RQV98999.1 MAG: hypothetical protein EH225_12240 [Calditrichota bacterium]